MKKNILFSVAISFFSILAFGQIETPVQCPSCEYGYKSLGQRKLIGEMRTYYGSMRTATSEGFSAKPSPADRPLQFGDVHPAMGEYALVYNYGPDGTAHLVLVHRSLSVFKRNGRVYAMACENLIEPVSFGKPVQKAPDSKPEEQVAGFTPQQPIPINVDWRVQVIEDKGIITTDQCYDRRRDYPAVYYVPAYGTRPYCAPSIYYGHHRNHREYHQGGYYGSRKNCGGYNDGSIRHPEKAHRRY